MDNDFLQLKRELEELKRSHDELKSWKTSLERDTSIPLAIDQSFRSRFFGNMPILSTSSKGASTEDINAVTTVNFVGQTTTATAVLGDPDGFLEVQIGGVTYYLPYFD